MSSLIESSPEVRPKPSVTSVDVKKLFGEFDYHLDIANGQEHNLTVLYGDNGCGKTTLLKLLVHILSPEPYAGHRTAIGNTPFRQFTVTLTDGYEISATRIGKSLTGEFTLSVDKNGARLVHYIWTPDDTRAKRQREIVFEGAMIYHAKVVDDIARDDDYMKFCQTMATLDVSVHLLSDSRKVLSFQTHRRGQNVDLTDFDDESTWLTRAIRDAVQTVSSLTIAGTNRGFESSNQIYKKIASQLISASSDTRVPPPELREQLQIRLRFLGSRNEAFSQFGLTSTFEVDDLIETLKRASDEQIVILDNVLRPYLDGVQARLDALNEAQKVASSFSELMSDFYGRKQVVLNLSEGVSIKTRLGQSLKPDQLSSGEQQLMLILCNAITARHRSVVFAIDEPELSLNVKWQRKLVDALLQILEGSRCQLLLATHSIELLAKYRAHTVHLTETDEIE